MDDLAGKVAAAPRNQGRKVQTLRELDGGEGGFSASGTKGGAGGIDLSLLTASLCPPEALEEADEVWEFDRLLQQLSQALTADAERREKEEGPGSGTTSAPGAGASAASSSAATAGRAAPSAMATAGRRA
jgi:hypothetical protein